LRADLVNIHFSDNTIVIHTYRLLRAKAARSKLRVPRVWFWHLGLKPQDVFQASYPRSGSTWLRFILFEILRGEEAGFGKIDRCMPEIDAHRGVPPILPECGRLIKTHEKYRKDYTKAILLVRDIRDVLISCYLRGVELDVVQLVSKGDFDSFLLSFLEGRALQMGSWQEHTRTWLEAPLARNGRLMVVRYEDLRQNSEQVLSQLLHFLGVTPDLGIIRKAIENNSLQQMRAKEDKARKAGERSVVLESRESTQEDGRFVRKGTVGGWRGKLTDAQLTIIGQYAGDVLATLGYDHGLAEKQPSESNWPD
jgi:sulfotransferase family protein